MERNWGEITEAIVSTCHMLGSKKCQNKQWISVDTPDKFQERKNDKRITNNSNETRAKKPKTQDEYKESSKRVKKKH